jgi:hypothetical protein
MIQEQEFKTMRYEIQDQHGEVLSRHRTFENAEKRHKKNLNWHCGICGSHKGGWGACSHGSQRRVCSADHYSDRIVQVS